MKSKRRLYNYITYGLNIESELPLPELLPGVENKADISIRLDNLDWFPPEKMSTGYCFQLTPKEAYLFWTLVGAFRVRNGAEIIVDPQPGVEEAMIRLPLLGMVLATLLYQRGFLVLHGSAVSLNGNAIAFLGDKGWGKSAMAAILHQRGHCLASDDAVAIRINGSSCPMLLPAFPRQKLWPDVVASLGNDPERFDRLSTQLEKRDIQTTERFLQTPVPFKCIYVLDIGSPPKIKRLRPQEAMVQLLRHLYVARFGNQLQQNGDISHFFQCATLVKAVPVYRLIRPRSLDLLPAIAQLVEEHVIER